MLLVKDVRLALNATKADACIKALSVLGVKQSEVQSADIAKVSVDARRRPISIVYTVAVSLKNAGAELSYEGFAPCVSFLKKQELVITRGNLPMPYRPVVCGFGPAGIFAALILARAGFAPIVIEKGEDIDSRVASVDGFWQSGKLNISSNVQFGEGGAGAFSDGKLTTRINDPLCAFVTEVLLKHGAPREIAIKQKPHIGTDLLRNVIRNIRNEIISLGGEVRFSCALSGIRQKNGKICAVNTTKGDILCSALILAVGHSARDIFSLLPNCGVALTPKPFSVGFRIEHLQADIDKALYGDAAGNPALPQGEYQLSQHIGDKCVYTFCMCPGGVVVPAASEEGRVVTNGMSYHARNGKNANSAVVVSVNESDYGNSAEKAIEFQRTLEQAAYKAGGGNYKAPAQGVKAFLNSSAKIGGTCVEPSYALGVTEYNLQSLLPQPLTNALCGGLMAFDKRIKGFAGDGAVFTGLETRTSSPVRILRSAECESAALSGLYPCGEGAGYAGGIMSAAVDGVKVARNIAQTFCPGY